MIFTPAVTQWQSPTRSVGDAGSIPVCWQVFINIKVEDIDGGDMSLCCWCGGEGFVQYDSDKHKA